MVKVKPVQNGRTTRMSFSRINEVIGMPNLIEIQKNSYNWFLEEGLHEVFHDIAAIEDYTGNLVLEFLSITGWTRTPSILSRNAKSGMPMQAPVCHGPPAEQADRRGAGAGNLHGRLPADD